MHTMDWTDCKGFTSMSDEKVGHTHKTNKKVAVLKRGQTSLSIIFSSKPLQNDYHHYCFIYSQGIHNFNFAKYQAGGE